MFKTELHCHSKSVSACARVSNEEIIQKFTEAGYTSLVLTNHFNKGTQDFLGCANYQDFVTSYLKGYEDLKRDASGKLNVILGMELRFNENSNDYLVFGITEELLRAHEDIFSLNPESFSKISRENGLLFIQAHPFRNTMTVINPAFLDGVEVKGVKRFTQLLGCKRIYRTRKRFFCCNLEQILYRQILTSVMAT